VPVEARPFPLKQRRRAERTTIDYVRNMAQGGGVQELVNRIMIVEASIMSSFYTIEFIYWIDEYVV